MLRKIYAQGNITGPNIPALTTLEGIFGLITNIVLWIGVALTVIFLIVGGIQYITSRGDQKAAETARKSLTNAVIGFIIVIGAFSIRALVLNLIGGGNVISQITVNNGF
ncbi:MAG: hypothetical protein WC243_00290 [Patescibacteria group bacterium]|jgi:hypothetical protein